MAANGSHCQITNLVNVYLKNSYQEMHIISKLLKIRRKVEKCKYFFNLKIVVASLSIVWIHICRRKFVLPWGRNIHTILMTNETIAINGCHCLILYLCMLYSMSKIDIIILPPVFIEKPSREYLTDCLAGSVFLRWRRQLTWVSNTFMLFCNRQCKK